MFAGIISGTGLLRSGVRALVKYPVLFVPLLLCWISYAPVIVYLKFYFAWSFYSQGQQLTVAFLAILFFSFSLSLACLILLKLIRQIEIGDRPRLGTAILQAIPCIIDAIPITLVWAFVWFGISILACLFRRREYGDDDEMEDFNAESVAETLAGYEEFSLAGAFFDALNKGIRMVVFLIFPALAWEQNDLSTAIKRGLAVAKTHHKAFVVGFLLTEVTALTLFIPPSLLFFSSHQMEVELPDWVWLLTMLYCAFAWSFSMFLEQLFTAELYLWHLIWEEECSHATTNGNKPPELHEVRRPSIMDDIADLSRLVVAKTQPIAGK